MKCDALFSFLKSSKFDEKRFQSAFMGIFFGLNIAYIHKKLVFELRYGLVGLNDSPQSHSILETNNIDGLNDTIWNLM